MCRNATLKLSPGCSYHSKRSLIFILTFDYFWMDIKRFQYTKSYGWMDQVEHQHCWHRAAAIDSVNLRVCDFVIVQSSQSRSFYPSKKDEKEECNGGIDVICQFDSAQHQPRIYSELHFIFHQLVLSYSPYECLFINRISFRMWECSRRNAKHMHHTQQKYASHLPTDLLWPLGFDDLLHFSHRARICMQLVIIYMLANWKNANATANSQITHAREKGWEEYCMRHKNWTEWRTVQLIRGLKLGKTNKGPKKVLGRISYTAC